ncbi:Dolichyl-phosphate-mannose-protein mannosyltransferase [Abditibacterium utsteinense]|uniref:Dolichyl-phosphate-mannose-protein mannosyltransferase n=1 Tax=Abditibacterium utsteinense TaxID=1960156 RepID=A0A2S8SWN7_9BACT|nr:glycosyltransferase family 39 protein [Abditibacterium utsteinense]PQV65215.1 Dolichyl-phosphate-mannose-protein mannosyltransferase [Abditibacterium utsteinense]
MQPNRIRWEKVFQSQSLILFCLSAIVILIRSLTFYEPYERDLMVYAVTARELLAGRPIYSDLWDIKPPGVYIIYALSQSIVGYNRFSIFFLGVSSAIVTLFGVFQTVKIVTRHSIAALWAAFFWTLICSDIALQANQPNVEVFLNALFVWALFYFIKSSSNLQKDNSDSYSLQLEKTDWKWLLVSGSLWGIASLFKQVALTTPFFLSFTLFIFPLSGFNWKKRLLSVAAFVTPILLLWAGVSAYFSATGRWSIFYFTMVDYGRRYASSGFRLTSDLTWSEKLFPAYLALLIPTIALSLAGLVVSRHHLSRFWLLLGLCALSIQIAIALPGNFFPHYYQLWLPLLCIAMGFSIAEWKRNTKNQSLVMVTIFLVGFVTLGSQWIDWKLTPDQVSIKKYSEDYFVRLPLKAQEINGLLLPNETFYQYGFDPGFYFETKRRSPVGIINIGTPFIPQPLELQNRLLFDLKQKKPEMVILDTFFPPSRVTEYLYENYVLLPHLHQSGNLVIMARRGGNLLRRS